MIHVVQTPLLPFLALCTLLLSPAVTALRGNFKQENLGFTAKNDGPLPPVIIVPGIRGNQLEARLLSSYQPLSWACYSVSEEWFRLWLSIPSMAPAWSDCWSDRMRLQFNESSGRFGNARGVETRVPMFGTTEGSEYLDPMFSAVSAYTAPLVDALVAAGYVRGENLLGAPYDFRYVPGPAEVELVAAYRLRLRALVEFAYQSNGHIPVVLVGHSLGCLHLQNFLAQQPLAWRNKFVRRFVAVSAPWGGLLQQMRVLVSGDTAGFPLLDPISLRYQMRHSEATYWLLPAPAVAGSTPVVFTPTRSYAAGDVKQLLSDVGFPEGVKYLEDRQPPLSRKLDPPGVPLTLIYGTGLDTPSAFNYTDGDFDAQPNLIMGVGDGVAPLWSLKAVTNMWKAVVGQDVSVVEVPQGDHNGIIFQAAPTIVTEVVR